LREQHIAGECCPERGVYSGRQLAHERDTLEIELGSITGGVPMLSTAPIRAYIPAADLQRARRFYEQTLGLPPGEEYGGGVVYKCGGADVFMYPTGNAGTSKASQAFWQVNDVEAEVAELKARGVVFEEYDMPGIRMKNSIATGGGAKTAWFKDSEGNIMALSQRLR
jgi:catechol 2,3-dioxygenase-like lactoylglutathione lyase family enzyme